MQAVKQSSITCGHIMFEVGSSLNWQTVCFVDDYMYENNLSLHQQFSKVVLYH